MFEINSTVLKGAKTYLPLAEKSKIAVEIAANCVTEIGYNIVVGNIPIDVPNWRGRNIPLKERYLMGALLKYYLGFRFVPVEGTAFLLSLDDYDRAASQHPRNALERCKGDRETRDIAFDLLADYKTLREMTNAALDETVAARNDPVARYLAAQTMTMTPEALEALTNAEKTIRERLDDLKATGAEATETIKERGARLAEAAKAED